MMEYMHAPSTSVNFSVPPPSLQHQTSQPPHQQSEQQTPPPPQRLYQSGTHHQSHSHYQRHYHGGYSGKSGQNHFRSFNNFNRGHGGMAMVQDDFDGKRLRKSVMRKTVDYNSSIVRALEVCTKISFNRLWLTNFKFYLIFDNRTEYGNVIIVIAGPCSLKVYMHQRFFHLQVTWIIQ